MAIKETKNLRGFRMWKSGKHWLFGVTVTASVLLGGQLQTFADSPQPTNPAVIEEVKDISSTVVATSGEQTGKENNEQEAIEKVKTVTNEQSQHQSTLKIKNIQRIML